MHGLLVHLVTPGNAVGFLSIFLGVVMDPGPVELNLFFSGCSSFWLRTKNSFWLWNRSSDGFLIHIQFPHWNYSPQIASFVFQYQYNRLCAFIPRSRYSSLARAAGTCVLGISRGFSPTRSTNTGRSTTGRRSDLLPSWRLRWRPSSSITAVYCFPVLASAFAPGSGCSLFRLISARSRRMWT